MIFLFLSILVLFCVVLFICNLVSIKAIEKEFDDFYYSYYYYYYDMVKLRER